MFFVFYFNELTGADVKTEILKLASLSANVFSEDLQIAEKKTFCYRGKKIEQRHPSYLECTQQMPCYLLLPQLLLQDFKRMHPDAADCFITHMLTLVLSILACCLNSTLEYLQECTKEAAIGGLNAQVTAAIKALIFLLPMTGKKNKQRNHLIYLLQMSSQDTEGDEEVSAFFRNVQEIRAEELLPTEVMGKLKKLEDSVENLKKIRTFNGKFRKFNCTSSNNISINIICSTISINIICSTISINIICSAISINIICSTISINIICSTISNADKTEFFKKKEYFQPSNQILETFTKALSQNNAFIINLKVFQIVNHFLKAKKKNHQSSYYIIKLF
ncbi:uncharacterized protein LOC124809958 isoform X2 [Hydra vulgaris]|uniref:uncharacterized protein LOC124809958 isoform X2 n=1 Tax=Hydra vulgaris TaxID=6087 RepID=UPI0032E9F8DF